MAAQVAHDVVKEALSMGDASSIDDSAKSTNVIPSGFGQAQPTSANTNGETPNGILVEKDNSSEDVVPVSDSQQDSNAFADLVGADSLGEGGGVQSVAADLSGGSDTDTSKADSLDHVKGLAKGHARSNSVKKPAAFKSVSVTKNFLAKAATAVPTARPGEKGSPASQSGTSTPLSAKPRLVAKSALGGPGSRGGLSKLNGAGGPDPTKVWNKNRPAPPPPQRQFTDEELKQQYGIHMASRLQTDESGKDKWADIEDDEDDWAPETVEWVDGTKSSVVAPASQPTPQPQEDKKLAPAEKVEQAVPQKPAPEVAQPTPTSTSTKTILKPGVHAANQLKSSGIAGRSPVDKPALVSKSPAPLPSKNPWAPLPPIDKIAPVFPNPPQPSVLSPFKRDPHGFDSLPPPPPGPTREIAADDFNRSWRDDRGTKELFNSRSGRYEPVNELRRGSIREEHGHRQPAVLQRPAAMDRSAPAEPSPAFQTNRSSGTDGASWSRRRTSSNVSSSGGRRPSFSRPPDGLEGISPTSGAAVESPRQVVANLDRSLPAAMAGQRGWTKNSPINHQQASPVVPSQDVAADSQAVAEVPQEDPVARQQRLMREKIEAARLAKQRELEEEQREEAAKKERLRRKMEALAAATPSPELKETKAKDGTNKAPESSPTAKQGAVISVPKPPIPTTEGGVTQYGMMKVHQPYPVKKAFVTESSLTSKVNKDSTAEPREPATTAGVARSGRPPVAALDALGNNSSGADDGQQHRGTTGETSVWRPSAASSGAYSWANNGSNAYPPLNNVWGPPPNNGHRGLGNGTFGSYNTRQEEDNSNTDNRRIDNKATPSHRFSPHAQQNKYPPPAPRSSSTLQTPLPASSNQLSQLPHHISSPQSSIISSNNFVSSQKEFPDHSETKMSHDHSPVLATLAENVASPEVTDTDNGTTKAGTPGLEQPVKESLQEPVEELPNVDSFRDSFLKAMAVKGTPKSGPGMKPTFVQRFTWATLPENATDEQKSAEWDRTMQATKSIEEDERVVMFAETHSFATSRMKSIMVGPKNKESTKESTKAEATAKNVDFTQVRGRTQSKFQPLFEGQRADGPSTHGISVATGNAARPGMTSGSNNHSGNAIPHLLAYDPPAGTEHLFAREGNGPRVKLPTRPVVRLPSATNYKHLESQTATGDKKDAPAGNKVTHWRNQIHNLVHDRSVNATTKSQMTTDTEPPRVVLSFSLALSTVRVMQQEGCLPSGLWDSRHASAHLREAYRDWHASVKPPTDEELFGEPQFASRPNVCAPKKPHMNADLPPVQVDNTPRNARTGPVVVSAQSLDMAPTQKGSIVEVTVKTPGNTQTKTVTMQANGQGAANNHSTAPRAPFRGNPRRPTAGPANNGNASRPVAGPSNIGNAPRPVAGPSNIGNGNRPGQTTNNGNGYRHGTAGGNGYRPRPVGTANNINGARAVNNGHGPRPSSGTANNGAGAQNSRTNTSTGRTSGASANQPTTYAVFHGYTRRDPPSSKGSSATTN